MRGVQDGAPLPPRSTWIGLVEAALAEDVGPGDATTLALIPSRQTSSASIHARESAVIAGLPVAAVVFERCEVELRPGVADGDEVAAGAEVATVRGPARGILTGERIALNFLQRLTGVATLTRRYVRAVEGTAATVLDTRKTTPGWRALEKYAVRCGGGTNHRSGLFDGILIKDNHIAAVGAVGDAVKRARERAPAGLRIEIEVESLDQAREALEAGADTLLVDNRTPREIAEIVEWVAGRVPIEASGGVDLDSIAEIARTGVDRISVGALTHSARAIDIGLEWNGPSPR